MVICDFIFYEAGYLAQVKYKSVSILHSVRPH